MFQLFQGLIDALKKYSPLKQQMDQQSGHLLKQRDSSEQNSRLALQAADLLSRWANLERQTREQHSRSSSKTQEEQPKSEESTSKAPPILSQESVQNTDDFGKSVSNWLDALKDANSTLDFIEYPCVDAQNWSQRIEVSYFMLLF
jgi:hypothetical protein